MFQILGLQRAFTFFGFLCALLFAGWAVLSPPHNPSSPFEWWKLASGAVSTSALIVLGVGQTALFPYLCRLQFVRGWFPPLDGKWDAELRSNWAAIQQRSEPGSTPIKTSDVQASVTIIARLFHVRINLTSADRYSASKTIAVKVARDQEDGSVSLYYVYQNTTNTPLPTDSASHYGAASLKVEQSGGDIWLDGVYWTNRNWHTAQNTAGAIELRRARAH